MNCEKQSETYESPKLKFVSLRNEKEVANTCWGYANQEGENLYYNSPGYGWVVFEVTGNNCKETKTLNYKIKGYKDGMTDDQQAAAAKALDNYWNTTGANGGSPFQGSSSEYSETPPGDSWS